MAQLIHCLMLLFIVFVIAEIRNVLVSGDPQHAAPLTIWDEARQPSGTINHDGDTGHSLSYRL